MTTTLANVNLFVRNVELAVRFYVDVIGLEHDVDRSTPPSFALLQAGSCTLTLQDAAADGAAFGPSRGIELGFAVADVAAARERLIAAEMEVGEVQAMGWGSACDAADPDGHRLTVFHLAD